MKTVWPFAVIVTLAIAACTSRPHAKPDADLTWRPAIDLILSAFEQYPLVAVSEGAGHGQVETRDFFAALIRDRRFAGSVRNVVIEFGNARYQAVIDRYVLGEAVTRDELRHVWEDTTQISGVWSLPMYEQILADVRSVNQGLPRAQRIRVIAGYGGHPSRGLPTVAHALVGKRERRLVSPAGTEPGTRNLFHPLHRTHPCRAHCWREARGSRRQHQHAGCRCQRE
jgi:hypothetical protein